MLSKALLPIGRSAAYMGNLVSVLCVRVLSRCAMWLSKHSALNDVFNVAVPNRVAIQHTPYAIFSVPLSLYSAPVGNPLADVGKLLKII